MRSQRQLIGRALALCQAAPPAAVAARPTAPATGGGPDYRLSKERILAHCDAHNIILVTFVNSNRANYAYTWAGHIIRLKLTNYMVGAMDDGALAKLAARNITARRRGSNNRATGPTGSEGSKRAPAAPTDPGAKPEPLRSPPRHPELSP